MMITLKMALRSWKKEPVFPLVVVILISISVSLLISVQTIQEHVNSYWTSQTSGVDVVVGAKGSPLQLVLANVFHADAPTGNISWKDFNYVASQREVKIAVPLAYGDTYLGYRILGTDSNGLAFYKVKLKNGRLPDGPFETVVGSRVAALTGLKVGDSFNGTHGTVQNGKSHHEHPYTVVGLLKESKMVDANLIFTPIESVWESHHISEKNREVTAVLVQLKTAMSKLTFPRKINNDQSLMASVPAIEVNKLLTLTGDVSAMTKQLGVLLSLVSLLILFFILLNMAQNRKKELALFRFEGAPKSFALMLLLTEGALLTLAGILIALPVSLWVLTQVSHYHPMFSNVTQVKVELVLFYLVMALILVLVTAVIPWIKINYINLSDVFKQELD